MKIFCTSDGRALGDVSETKLSSVSDFIGNPSTLKNADDFVMGLRNELRNHAEKYASLLSAETGNPITWCREEINETVRSLDSWNKHGYNSEEKVKLLNSRFHAIFEMIPAPFTLVIGSKIAPLLNFVVHFLSSLETGSRLIYSPSKYGSLTLSSLWEDVSEGPQMSFLPLFSNHEGSNFRNILANAGRMRIIFRGTDESMHVLLRKAPVHLTIDEKIQSVAVVLDGDTDLIARSIASSLRWVKDTMFSPKRVLVKEELLEYMFNAVSEESYRLRFGDPCDSLTDLPGFMSSTDRDAFIEDIAQEKNQWNTLHSDPEIIGNSSSPAILKVEDKFGPFWNRGPFWPFLVMKGIKSVDEAFGMLRNEQRAIVLYSEDVGIVKKFLSSGFNIISNPPAFISAAEYLSLESCSKEYLLERRNVFYWS